MDKLNSSVVVQIGLIVKDVLKSAHYYAEVFGIPEPEVVPIASDAFANTNVRGKASTARGKAAFFHLGTVEMELIEPVGGPSTWNEFLQTHGEGIHHLAIKNPEMAGGKHSWHPKEWRPSRKADGMAGNMHMWIAQSNWD